MIDFSILLLLQPCPQTRIVARNTVPNEGSIESIKNFWKQSKSKIKYKT